MHCKKVIYHAKALGVTASTVSSLSKSAFCFRFALVCLGFSVFVTSLKLFILSLLGTKKTHITNLLSNTRLILSSLCWSPLRGAEKKKESCAADITILLNSFQFVHNFLVSCLLTLQKQNCSLTGYSLWKSTMQQLPSSQIRMSKHSFVDGVPNTMEDICQTTKVSLRDWNVLD